MTERTEISDSVRRLRRAQLLNDIWTLRLSGKPDEVPIFEDLSGIQSSNAEQEAAFERLVGYLATEWSPHREAEEALQHRRGETDQSREEVKREALRFGLWTALGATKEQQETQLGRSSLRRLGDQIVVYQKQDIKVLDRLSAGKIEELPPDVSERLREPAVGERTRLLHAKRGPIEGALLGDYSDKVRPVDLHPDEFLHWLHRHAIVEARDWLLEATDKTREPLQRDLERAERAEEQGGWASEADENAGRRVRKAIVEFEGIREANRGALEWVDPEEAALMRVGLENLLDEMTMSEREKLMPMLKLLREIAPESGNLRQLAEELDESAQTFYTAFSRMRERYENPL